MRKCYTILTASTNPDILLKYSIICFHQFTTILYYIYYFSIHLVSHENTNKLFSILQILNQTSISYETNQTFCLRTLQPTKSSERKKKLKMRNILNMPIQIEMSRQDTSLTFANITKKHNSNLLFRVDLIFTSIFQVYF